MTVKALLVVGAAVAMAVTGCVTGKRGTFDGGGYVSTYGYLIPYAQGTHSLISPDWTLENFERSEGKLRRKSSEPYLVTYRFDETDGGTLEGYRYELRYENRKHEGVIAMSDIPIPRKNSERELHVLMRSYIGELGAPTYTTVRDGAASTIVVGQPGVPVVIQEGPAVLAGQPAYVATVDLVPRDLPAGTRYSPTRRIQMVLLRPPHGERFEPTNLNSPTYHYPVALLATYVNAPGDFAAGLPDFHMLLRRIVIAGKSGFEPPPAKQPDAAAPMASLTVTGT